MIPTHVPAYTDFAQLAELKAGTQAKSGENLMEVARQFEAVFTHMMIKSMRQAVPTTGMLNNNGMETYQGMFDQQIALAMAQGKGLGIAEAMMRQLQPDAARQAPDVLPPPASEAQVPGPRQTQVALKAYGALQAPPVDIALRSPFRDGGINTEQLPVSNPARQEVLKPGADEQHTRPGSPENFIARIWPAAKRIATELGVSPRVLVAQAALETGWGKHMPRDAQGSSHNYFGIKTHDGWHGRSVQASTTEMVNGQPRSERAAFRGYASIEASFRDFADFLKANPRYEKALSVTHDANKFVDALQKAGYATDPGYADKIKSIMNGHRMNSMIASKGNAGAQVS